MSAPCLLSFVSNRRARTTLQIAASIATIRTAVGAALFYVPIWSSKSPPLYRFGQIWTIPSELTRNHRFVLPHTGLRDSRLDADERTHMDRSHPDSAL